jgi:hypothetical protein
MKIDPPPANRAPNASTPHGCSGRSSERQAHRNWIAGAIATLFGQYFQNDHVDMLTAAIAKNWCDDLERFPQDVIDRVLTRWRNTEERRPCPAQIIKRCAAEMPRLVMPTAPEPERQPPTDEEKARIQQLLAEAGFRPRRFGDSP